MTDLAIHPERSAVGHIADLHTLAVDRSSRLALPAVDNVLRQIDRAAAGTTPAPSAPLPPERYRSQAVCSRCRRRSRLRRRRRLQRGHSHRRSRPADRSSSCSAHSRRFASALEYSRQHRGEQSHQLRLCSTSQLQVAGVASRDGLRQAVFTGLSSRILGVGAKRASGPLQCSMISCLRVHGAREGRNQGSRGQAFAVPEGASINEIDQVAGSCHCVISLPPSRLLDMLYSRC